MRIAVAFGALAAALAIAAQPRSGDAQVWKRIKEQTAKKIEARKDSVDSTLTRTSGRVVDSTLIKTNRGVDAAANKIASGIDTVANKTERGVTSAFAGGGIGADPLATALKSGRAVVREIEFTPGSDVPLPSAVESLRRLADALKGTSGAYLVEGHTDATSDAAADQALSQRRAAAVKAALIERGIPPERLFAVGYGGTRPAQAAGPAPGHANARIEVARMQ